METDKR